jgi:RimJ/RimL family protein N-acetyltransferase
MGRREQSAVQMIGVRSAVVSLTVRTSASSYRGADGPVICSCEDAEVTTQSILTLTTGRLVLTPFERERDWSDFVADLVLDPVVTRYWADFAIPDLSDTEKQRLAAEEFLPWFDEGRARGLVVWTVRTGAGEFVGVSGLMPSEPPVGGPDPEFGCLLATRWHGQGFATEAGEAVLADAESRLGLGRVITVMDSPNAASRRLVDKLGFRFDEAVFDEDGKVYLCFVADRPKTPPT